MLRQLATTPVDWAGIRQDWRLGKSGRLWNRILILVDETRQGFVDGPDGFG